MSATASESGPPPKPGKIDDAYPLGKNLYEGVLSGDHCHIHLPISIKITERRVKTSDLNSLLLKCSVAIAQEYPPERWAFTSGIQVQVAVPIVVDGSERPSPSLHDCAALIVPKRTVAV